jgi:hypothetical protein
MAERPATAVMMFRTDFFPIDLFGLTKPGGLIPTFASHCGGHFANVGIEGPLGNSDSSGALDLTFGCEPAASRASETSNLLH